jgi:hypothetical protein
MCLFRVPADPNSQTTRNPALLRIALWIGGRSSIKGSDSANFARA